MIVHHHLVASLIIIVACVFGTSRQSVLLLGVLAYEEDVRVGEDLLLLIEVELAAVHAESLARREVLGLVERGWMAGGSPAARRGASRQRSVAGGVDGREAVSCTATAVQTVL